MGFFAIASDVVSAIGFIYIVVILFDGIYDSIHSMRSNHHAKRKETAP